MSEESAAYGRGYRDEEEKMRRLRKMVDKAARILTEDPLSEREALEFIEETRRNVLILFPDKNEEFELIYRPRFKRLLEENAGVQCDRALREDSNHWKGEEDVQS
ncbi:MAG: hypothetical protein CO150_06975 [Nitrospirae bacterium CG_4_9_14_3_um_filter_53_35]|nr:MAG: hypothetical protein AUK29_05335 [Nitrospirae bacterium CG2_30_53_67]PIS37843.1 MAG: hypothetical protein COT35_03935 [Nitrospirae bacterium CG08_land_8_20_14_0_20_52_24]PIV85396.1 MAG: hypothetical protein COW52_02470 [Nitrospirae bacterium CG17_big_fil_post_rev_8_21_14_2_50_50_9]PIW85155.1 MAG: hypothetical protein COZ95_06115 [Nitrospirae bacterium CG_4_8_14_3_um_filter_50_41]PIX86751.1 MAG: hypothetical protein COZ32_01690 [Nitrospirae bacterium CG_4_10_14_3_um_filter_53_41]PJA7420